MASQCGKTGNAIQFVQHFDGLSFRHAFELLDQGAAFSKPTNTNGHPVKKTTVPKLPCPIDSGAGDFDEKQPPVTFTALNGFVIKLQEKCRENPAKLFLTAVREMR